MDPCAGAWPRTHIENEASGVIYESLIIIEAPAHLQTAQKEVRGLSGLSVAASCSWKVLHCSRVLGSSCRQRVGMSAEGVALLGRI